MSGRRTGHRQAVGVQRWLPRSWRGAGREARWRRSRARRICAGLLGGCAALSLVAAVRPSPPATYPVTVAAHDLPAGSHLTRADLRQVRWTRGDRVPGLLTAGTATGKVLTAAIRAGEPLTDARVRSARSWPSVHADKVIIGVSSADSGILRVLQPGDRIDLIDTTKAATLATAVPVVSVPAPSDPARSGSVTSGSGWSAADAPTVLVAVTPAQAAAVGSAAAARAGGVGGGIQLALRATG